MEGIIRSVRHHKCSEDHFGGILSNKSTLLGSPPHKATISF
ncbi:hypothetical protein SAMN04488023_15415, partial [Pedobacter rhizosphaerae]